MANIVRTELLLDDGTFMQFKPSGQNRYAHMADRFNVWGQKVSFYQNHEFDKIFKEVVKERESQMNNPEVKMIVWRAHVAASLATFCKDLGSNFVECGVNVGLLSGCIFKLLDRVGYGKMKNFYLFDTYHNIPEDQFDEKIEPLGRWHNKNNYKKDIYPFVRDLYKPYKQAHVIQGVVPDILEKYKGIKDVSFLSLDMNIVYPEKAAMEFFWDRMVPGGVVLLDDYGYINHDPQQDYFDQFCRERGTVPVQLPTGQAMVIKTLP